MCTKSWATWSRTGPCPTTWVVVATNHTSLSDYKWKELYILNKARTECIFVGMYCIMQYIPTNMHTVFALLCLLWSGISRFDRWHLGLLHWHSHQITPVSNKIWENASRKVMAISPKTNYMLCDLLNSSRIGYRKTSKNLSVWSVNFKSKIIILDYILHLKYEIYDQMALGWYNHVFLH